ncbi:hypothetical protein [Ferruginibacter sp. SUN106]
MPKIAIKRRAAIKTAGWFYKIMISITIPIARRVNIMISLIVSFFISGA